MDWQEGEIIGIDKPLHWTSFDVVGKMRWLLCHHLGVKKLKVGHTGTLDPLATGVVVVCTGKKTKLIDSLQQHVKEYIATLQLGATTPSYDLEKAIDNTYPDLTILLDVTPEVGLSRIKSHLNTHEFNRMDRESIEFHKRTYEGYHKVQEMFPDRIKIVNGERTIEEVSIDVYKLVIDCVRK